MSNLSYRVSRMAAWLKQESKGLFALRPEKVASEAGYNQASAQARA